MRRMRRALIGAIGEAAAAGFTYGRRGNRPKREVRQAAAAWGTCARNFRRGYLRAFGRQFSQLDLFPVPAGSGRKIPIRRPVQAPGGPRKSGRPAAGAPAPAGVGV